MSKNIPIALTIAGSDSSGGAGIQADIKTMSARKVYAASVIVAITAQNTKEVRDVFFLDNELIQSQIDTVFDDLNINSVKIGMLGSVDIIKTVAKCLKERKAKNIVLDPVMIAKSGDRLLEINAISAIKRYLIPLSCITTPNIPEAMELLGLRRVEKDFNKKEIAKKVYDLGSQNVLLKDGHGSGEYVCDVFYDGKSFQEFKNKRLNKKNTHGTGCSLSSSIASELAKGENMRNSVKNSITYINKAIEKSDDISVGRGTGPIHHFYEFF